MSTVNVSWSQTTAQNQYFNGSADCGSWQGTSYTIYARIAYTYKRNTSSNLFEISSAKLQMKINTKFSATGSSEFPKIILDRATNSQSTSGWVSAPIKSSVEHVTCVDYGGGRSFSPSILTTDWKDIMTISTSGAAEFGNTSTKNVKVSFVGFSTIRWHTGVAVPGKISSLTADMTYVLSAKPSYTIDWNKNECTTSGGSNASKSSYYYGEAFTYPNLSKDSSSETIEYTLTWDSQGGSSVEPTKTSSTKTTSYSDFYWWSSGESKRYECGASDKVYGNDTLTAKYTPNYSTTEASVKNVQSKPSKNKQGYDFDSWYTGKNGAGTKVSESTVVSGNTTFYANWTAKQFNVNYNLNLNTTYATKLRSGKTAPESQIAVYNENVSLQPTKFDDNDYPGFRFAGWSKSKDDQSVVYSPGQSVNLSTGDALDVTLYAVWQPINQHIRKHFYTSSGQQSETYTYNRETGSTVSIPNIKDDLMGEDYTFLGWTEVQPADWAAKRGIYTDPKTKPKTTLPFVKDTTVFTKEYSWNDTNNDIDIYGIWTVSGKRVKTSSGWQKVSETYVKTENGWKFVESTYVKTNNGWKQEVH